MLGDCMRNEITEIAKGFTGNGIEQLWVLTRSEETTTALYRALDAENADNIDVRCIGDDIEGALDNIRAMRAVLTWWSAVPLNACP